MLLVCRTASGLGLRRRSHVPFYVNRLRTRMWTKSHRAGCAQQKLAQRSWSTAYVEGSPRTKETSLAHARGVLVTVESPAYRPCDAESGLTCDPFVLAAPGPLLTRPGQGVCSLLKYWVQFHGALHFVLQYLILC